MPKLVRLPPDGEGPLWVNLEHLVTIRPIELSTGETHPLDVELKITGMNLLRIRIGQYPSVEQRQEAWEALLESLQP